MDLLAALIVLIVVIAVFGSAKGKNRRPRRRATNKPISKPTPAKRMATRDREPDAYSILYQHWKDVEEGKIAVPRWYHDPVTEPQLKRLREDNIALPGRPITKGQASELIRLGEPPHHEQEEILQFFKVKGLPLEHEIIAEIEINQLMADPEKALKWVNRPATPMQKEYYRYFGMKIPKQLTATEAQETIYSHELTDQQDDEWSAYWCLIEDIQDPDIRECYDLKKPSLPIIREAIQKHQDKGEQLIDISPDDVIETILKLWPELQK